MMSNKPTNQLSISEKYNLTAEEASQYFNIGINKMRRMINENDTADWVLWNGTHALIRRKQFERFIDAQSAI